MNQQDDRAKLIRMIIILVCIVAVVGILTAVRNHTYYSLSDYSQEMLR